MTGGGESFVVQVSRADGTVAAAAAGAAGALAGGAAASVAGAAASTQGAAITAPLAGNIWKIEVTEGQQVEEGDLLFVLEAMKMENEVLADRAGVVSTIQVKEGDTVDLGAVLLTFDGEKTGDGAAPSVAGPGAMAPAASIAAPLAGNIWKIEVAPGEQVREGDLLLILEAMKMENEICAERDGTVGELFVREGQSVEIGQMLLSVV